jgi:hypothetical protein
MGKPVGVAAAALLFLWFAPAPVAAAAAERTVHELIAQAHSVALGYDLGDRFLSETAADANANAEVLPEERRALQAIADDIKHWGRFVIATRPQDAELLIAVRIGERVPLGGGIHDGSGGVGGPFDGPAGVRRGPSYNSGRSSSDDVLTIYHPNGVPLWTGRKRDGLSGEPPKLYEEFRADVERTPEPAPEVPSNKPQ